MRTRLRSKVTLLFMTCAVLLTIPAMALADSLTVSNTLVTNTDTSKAPGDTGTLNAWLEETNGTPADDRNGCNATDSNPATVTFTSNNPSVTFPNGNTVQLTGCSENASHPNAAQLTYQVANNAQPGQAVIKAASITGGKSGSTYNTNDALTVTITAPAKQNTTVALDPTSGTYGDNATFKATLTDLSVEP
jgi:hypothetical protein